MTAAVAPDVRTTPESLLLTFFGTHVLGRGTRVSVAGVVDVLQRVGTPAPATRSALTRMVSKGLLDSRRVGRHAYLGLTSRSEQVLQDGGARVWRTGAVNRFWDGRWTLLSFSLPGSWQRQRHELRARLVWAGFGPVQGGLWIAPGTVDVVPLLAGASAAPYVRSFVATPGSGDDVPAMVAAAWDLDAIAEGYRGFADRWDGGPADRAHTDPLARQLLLETEWLQLVRADPRLPVELLPGSWPAGPAQELFHRLHAAVDPAARALAAQLLDTLPEDAP
ncbi:PaaX family transcriptional regulator C-terminal domain-containing protein [Klenkia sp. PcliD-1-E]|uniref:PaaX family transcriptional regulator n=1 Tax=Klenkia sp. PcliD-1-E TaxID=2954492 RepID=UPI0020985478|nr:PaaX family transcriptional regulator C-terminal domain-containing protein [Klenkia sp. PcliD-1-E]MCO7218501.1 hypothetical protein [Klenkia sp. PcliD-1-E]